ncbi:hypothetical protein ACFV1U_14535 [Streptomyces microflavus]|uniref:hypothetical protein n=1 Tax=Streptomyces microflavus TaxID=1919 RepID=UPI0036A27A02
MPHPPTTPQPCPHHPFGHTWDHTATSCSLCGATRTAQDATLALLAGLPGWDHERAGHLINRLHTDIRTETRTRTLEEASRFLAVQHCSPESVHLTRRLIDERVCPDCVGNGQIVATCTDEQPDTDAMVPVGIIRRCRTCNRRGLIRPQP